MPNPFTSNIQRAPDAMAAPAMPPTPGPFENTWYGLGGGPRSFTGMLARLAGNNPESDFDTVLAQALQTGGTKGNLADVYTQLIQQNPHLISNLPPEAFSHGQQLIQTLGALRGPQHVNEMAQTLGDLGDIGITEKTNPGLTVDVAQQAGKISKKAYTLNNGYLFDPSTGKVSVPQTEGAGQPSQPTPFIDTIIGAGEKSQGQFGADGKPLLSPKGAVGIAQVLPATGQAAAQAAGMPWDPIKFANDADYNRSIGEAYLGQLTQQYSGDETLASAAYNAGPARVDAWIKQYGDPRTAAITPEDWAAKIPIPETRDYVARVMGARGQQNPIGPIDLTSDFKVVGDTLVKTSQLRGTAEPVLNLRQPTELAQKIAYNISNGADPTLAVDLALGNIQVSPDPTSGEITMVNKRTNHAQVLAPDMAARIAQLQNAPPAELQATSASAGQGGLGTAPIESFASEAPGIWSGLATGISKVVSQFSGGRLVAAPTMAARENIRLFTQIAKQVFVNNPKFPAAEQQLLNDVLGDVGTLTPPAELVQRIGQLRDTMTGMRAAALQQAQNTVLPAKTRQEALGKVSEIDSLVALMGPDPRQGQAGAAPGSPTAQTGLDAVPEGNTITQGGRTYKKINGQMVQQ